MQFTVQKKDILKQIGLVNIVSGLKSVGASPSESSCLMFTPTTMVIYNFNEANAILVENIPIANVEGADAFVDKGLMVNTKKLSSVIKGSGDTIKFNVSQDKISIGEGKRKYDLSLFSIERREIPEIKLSDRVIETKAVLKDLQHSLKITNGSDNSTELSGTLFTGNKLLSSDRTAVLCVNSEFFGDAPDYLFSCDLFSSCLEDETFSVGQDTENKKIVVHFGNVTLYKTMLAESFPKESALGYMAKAIEGSTNSPKITLNVSDFSAKLNEIRSIVETNDYELEFKPDSIIISNGNAASGAEGSISLDITSTIPFEPVKALFSYAHLNTLCELFDKDVDCHLVLKDKKISYLLVNTEKKVFFFVPRD
jgi:hypothetical protein